MIQTQVILKYRKEFLRLWTNMKHGSEYVFGKEDLQIPQLSFQKIYIIIYW